MSLNSANRSWWSVSILAAVAVAVGGAYLLTTEIGSTGLNLQVAKLRSVTTKGSPTGIAWSPDGEKIAAIHDFGRAISVWNGRGDPSISIRREVTTGPYVGSSLAFMPDSQTFIAPASTPTPDAISSFGLWDTKTGSLQKVVPAPSSDKTFQFVVANIIAVSPDGTLVAVRPLFDLAPVSIYKTDDWSLVKIRPILKSESLGLKPSAASGALPKDREDPVTALAFSRNNDLAVGVTDGLAIIGSSQSSTLFRFFESRPVSCLAYSPNGQFIAIGTATNFSASTAGHPSHLQIRDAVSGRVIVEDNTIGDAQNVAWDRDGRIVAVATADAAVHLYRPFMDGASHQDVAVAKGALTLAFSPTKSELAVSTQTGVDFYSIK